MLKNVNELWMHLQSAVGRNLWFNKTVVHWFAGFERVAQLPVAEVYPNGFLKQNQPVAQIQMPERVQEGINSLSLEENKIMLSLDRLNHQLHCEQYEGYLHETLSTIWHWHVHLMIPFAITCVGLKTHRQSKTDNNGHITVGTPLVSTFKSFYLPQHQNWGCWKCLCLTLLLCLQTKESNNHKHQASSANLLHYQKKT